MYEEHKELREDTVKEDSKIKKITRQDKNALRKMSHVKIIL